MNYLSKTSNMNEDYIKSCTILKVLHGSRAYGTNIPSSDYDEKGVAILRDYKYYYGFRRFEQKDSGWTDGRDRVIYDIRKFTRLAASCNPNFIEVLFVEPENILQIGPIGQKLLDKRDIFLSQVAERSFVGYAVSQLCKLHKRAATTEGINWKSGMHLVRLLRMGLEIVRYGKVNVKRPDADELLDIRNGKWSLSKIDTYTHDLRKQINKAIDNSPLPPKPNMKKIENLTVDLIYQTLRP